MGIKTLVHKSKVYLKTLGRFIGPGFMIAVGYLDPGNWATDMEGGSSFGYRLLFIILISNIIAIFLQNLTIRLGTVTGLDLASASRRYFPRWLNWILYLLAEAAIIATDIAEVIGSAIALNLLFPKLPLPAGVAITAADVFIILMFYNDDDTNENSKNPSRQVKMVRYFEMFVMLLVLAVGICFIVELAYSDIVAVDLFKGFLPTKEIFTQPEILYVAIGIIGATVMPHNLYLHSFIVQARCREWRVKRPQVYKYKKQWLIKNEFITPSRKSTINSKVDSSHVIVSVIDTPSLKSCSPINLDSLKKYLSDNLSHNLHYGFVDLVVALLFAFFVNCAILIVAAANFYYGPGDHQHQVQDLFSAHALLLQYLGPPAAITFAIALLCAGQSSTLTATLAGQVVMSGFLGMSTRPWIRRIVTRLIAIIPAMVAACVAGREGLSSMLVGSQVALSIQLPFAVVPLIYFTMKAEVMKLDLVVESNTLEPDYPKPIVVSKDPNASWIDNAKSEMQSFLDWIKRPTQLDRQAIKDYFFQPTIKPTQDEDEAINESVLSQDNIENTHDKLESWPNPLIYPNGKLTNVFAILISLLLIGLNGYLVISFFL